MATAGVLFILLGGCGGGADGVGDDGEISQEEPAPARTSTALCEAAFAEYETAFEADPETVDHDAAQRRTVNDCTYDDWYDVAWDHSERGSILFADVAEYGPVDVDEVLDVWCETDLEAPACA